MDFAGALFAVGHKRFEFRALGLCKVYFPATRWHTPSWWSEYTKILQLSKDLLEKPLSTDRRKYVVSLLGSLLGSFPPCGGRSEWGVTGRVCGCSPPPWSSPNSVRHGICRDVSHSISCGPMKKKQA